MLTYQQKQIEREALVGPTNYVALGHNLER